MKSVRIVILASVIGLLCTPFLLTKSHAERGAGSVKNTPPANRTTTMPSSDGTLPQQSEPQLQQVVYSGPRVSAGPINPEIVAKLGLGSQQQSSGGKEQTAEGIKPNSAGLPTNMNAGAPFSAAVATTVARGFNEVDTMGDWDGREDDTADHSGKVMDATNVPGPVAANPNFFFTRTAFSEHSIANGFTQDIIYSADSVGNVYISSTTNLTLAAPIPNVFTINIPTAVHTFGTITPGVNSQFVITGLAVNPVADLGSFSAANAAYAADFPAGTIGEILYVAVTDTGSGFTTAVTGATVLRTAILTFPISDAVNAAAPAPPGRISPASYPVTVGASRAVALSTFSDLAGCAVDDDGNLFFKLSDLSGLTGANIVKATSRDDATNQDRALVSNGILLITTLSPGGGNYGTTTGPANQINQFTNYSGTSTFLGNVISLSTGQGNLLYAAVARSFNPADSSVDQATEGPFQNPGGLGATPSMVITFADANGSFDNCSAANPGPIPTVCPLCPPSTNTGIIPVGDGFADAVPGASTNWTAFVLGNGPDRRAASGSDSIIFGTSANTLKLDMGIDHSVYSGLTVDEEGTVYVISGGAPAGAGTNPSGSRSEILNLEDKRPADRRADYIDFRADAPPNPPASGGIVGDGDSDRFDHLYFVAPIDPATLAPAGLAGLTRGFLRYTNRQAPTAISPGVTLGLNASSVASVSVAAGGTGYTLNDVLTLTTGGTGATVQVTSIGGAGDVTGVVLLTNGSGYAAGVSVTTGGSGTGATINIVLSQGIQGDDTFDGPILFEAFDPSHQVAGGDDQVFPFAGDDDSGAGNPITAGPLSGGFEFTFANPLGDVFQIGAACGTGNGVWNGFFLNSNGNITFGGGDIDNTPTDPEFRQGKPRIAPAWADLNPSARSGVPGTFPVQAVGFANINAFKIRYINVPQFGNEGCASSNPVGSGLTNTMSITLYDDGTGVDENANQPLNPANPIGNNAVPFDLQEGATAPRFAKVTIGATNLTVSEPPRLDGSGLITLDYGRMDLLGDALFPVITGYSIGNQNPINPPGLCEIDLGGSAAAADTGFGNLGQAETRWPTFIGDGSEPEIHEFFHNAVRGSIDSATGTFTLSQPDFDLRFQGNGNATPATQIPPDVNRDRVGLYGTTCQLPTSPTVSAVNVGPFVTTPGTLASSLINAYGPVTLNLLGFGFFGNQTTTVCAPPSSGDIVNPDGPPPNARPGKTVVSAITVTFDTNGDNVPDLPVTLTNIAVISRNLVTGIAMPLPNGSGTGPGSPWPFNANGGTSQVNLTTIFTAGNNNIFNLLPTGGFNRSSTATLDTGARAPVVVGSTPSAGDSGALQNLTITGFDFQYTAATNIPVQPPPNPPLVLRPFNVTAVFAVQRDNPANVIQATSFNVLNNNTIGANFDFSGAPAGRQFLIFVQNAAGTSRNALMAPGGATPNGNEQGNLILFTVADTTPPTITCPANVTANAALGVSSATVSYPAPVATDNSPGVVVSCNPPSGSSFNLGTTLVTCTATDTSNNTASCSFNVTVVGTNTMHFSAATYSGAEGCTSATITVQRDNPNGTASVDVATSDGTAVQKSDYGITLGTVTFNAGETSKTFTVPINDDGFVEGPETVNLTLSNAQNGAAGNGPVMATLTITDDDLVPPAGNVNDTAATFVCQHYHDFLNRDPDPAGAAFWTSQITSCGANAACIAAARVSVSASFFLSIEFQETGGDVLRVQRVAFARRSNNALARYPYVQFMRDAQQVGRGVIVGQAGYQAVLDANKAAYVTQIVTSPAFITLFPTSQTATTYVDALFASAGVTPTTAERNAAIAAFGGGGTAGRAAALQSVADAGSVRSAEFNAAFVLLEYYGYLRRNPTDPPDNNDNGYQFWLTKLNAFNGNFIDSEMVKAFITSIEYRQRFGP